MSQDIQYSFERNPLWRVKLRLQNTGWLQYLPLLIIGQLTLLISDALVSYSPGVAFILKMMGKMLWTIGVFDILTLKFNIRPPEPRPKRRDDSEDNCTIIRLRHSCRSFQRRKLRDEDREEIIKIARMESKHTFGTTPIRLEYIDKPLQAWPTVNALQFFVAVGPAKYDRTSAIDVGHNLQAVVLHATRMGLATCWIGPGADHDSITSLLLKNKNVYKKESDHIFCVCAVGYKSIFVPSLIRLANIVSRIRKPYNELFFTDVHFQMPLNTTKHPFSRFRKCYEAARWSPSSFNAQPTRCVGTVNEDTVRFDFFSSTKSRFYAPIAVGIWLRDWEAACQSVGIKGRFAILSNQERGIEDNISPELPVYDMSWLEE